jgi:hypothetical protein
MLSNPGNKSVDELVAQGKNDLQAAAGIMAHYAESKHEALRSWAGSSLESLLHMREATQEYLQNPNPHLRITALLLIKDYWQPTPEIVQKCETIAFNDPDAQVRGTALLCVLRRFNSLSESTKQVLSRLLRESTSESEHDKLIERIQHMRARSQKPTRSISSLRLMIPETAAGPLLNHMLESRQITEEYLAHPTPQLRIAALSLLNDHWKATDGFAQRVEKMAFEDADTQVCAFAMVILGGLYAHTGDMRVGNLLARCVYDEAQQSRVRRAAYGALFKIRGLPARSWPVMRRRENQFRFPDDVDWRFVDSFLK